MNTFRTILFCALALAGCASVPKSAPHPVRADRDTPLAVIGIAQCGELQGVVVVTKTGEIVPIGGISQADLDALQALVGPGSAGDIDLKNDCLPKQTT